MNIPDRSKPIVHALGAHSNGRSFLFHMYIHMYTKMNLRTMNNGVVYQNDVVADGMLQWVVVPLLSGDRIAAR